MIVNIDSSPNIDNHLDIIFSEDNIGPGHDKDYALQINNSSGEPVLLTLKKAELLSHDRLLNASQLTLKAKSGDILLPTKHQFGATLNETLICIPNNGSELLQTNLWMDPQAGNEYQGKYFSALLNFQLDEVDDCQTEQPPSPTSTPTPVPSPTPTPSSDSSSGSTSDSNSNSSSNNSTSDSGDTGNSHQETVPTLATFINQQIARFTSQKTGLQSPPPNNNQQLPIALESELEMFEIAQIASSTNNCPITANSGCCPWIWLLIIIALINTLLLILLYSGGKNMKKEIKNLKRQR